VSISRTATLWAVTARTRLDGAGLLECELILGGIALDLDRLKQESNVIAEIDLLYHDTREPALAGVQQRDTTRPGMPRYLRKLVHLVACLAAKNLGDLGVVFVEHVHSEHTRATGQRERVILL
jgi:hypothetical protein